jgi:hypothetical protein
MMPMRSPLTQTFAAFLTALLLCAAADAEPVAMVGERVLDRHEFGEALVRTFGPSAITGVIDWVLVEQEARSQGVEATEEEVLARRDVAVDLAVRAAYVQARVSADDYRRRAESRGEDPSALRQELSQGLSLRAVRARLLAERMLADEVDLSEEAVRRYYERTRGRRYQVAHILTPGRPEAERIAGALELRPELWSELVLRLSLDRDSVPFKGRLPAIPAGSGLGPQFDGMRPGDMRVHESAAGWHVFRLIGTLPPAPEPYDEIKERLRAELLALETAAPYEAFLADLHRNATVVTNLARDPATREQLNADVVAYVNGEPVPAEDLAEVLVERLGRPMLASCIERMLIEQEAERRGVEVSAEELRERKEAIGRQLYEQYVLAGGEAAQMLLARMTRDEAADQLVRMHVNEDDVRATLLAEKMVADGLTVPEAAVTALYAESYGERVLAKEASFGTYADARRAYQSLRRGLDFDLMVQAELRGPGLWMTGALERVITPDDPSWVEVADLEPGDVSELFERGGRYRIIKVLERIQPADPPPLESVRKSLEREARLRETRARARALLQKLQAEARRSGTIKVLLD